MRIEGRCKTRKCYGSNQRSVLVSSGLVIGSGSVIPVWRSVPFDHGQDGCDAFDRVAATRNRYNNSSDTSPFGKGDLHLERVGVWLRGFFQEIVFLSVENTSINAISLIFLYVGT